MAILYSGYPLVLTDSVWCDWTASVEECVIDSSEKGVYLRVISEYEGGEWREGERERGGGRVSKGGREGGRKRGSLCHSIIDHLLMMQLSLLYLLLQRHQGMMPLNIMAKGQTTILA